MFFSHYFHIFKKKKVIEYLRNSSFFTFNIRFTGIKFDVFQIL